MQKKERQQAQKIRAFVAAKKKKRLTKKQVLAIFRYLERDGDFSVAKGIIDEVYGE